MFHHAVLLLTGGILILAVPPLGATTNCTLHGSGCLFKDIEARLSIASDILGTVRSKLPNDCQELCKEVSEKVSNDSRCKNTSHDEKPMDCSDIYNKGYRKDGLYEIWPVSRMAEGPVQVYCDMTKDGGGWTVIQRRGDFGNPEDFNRNWTEYKKGFGDKEKEFWFGNDNLFALTNQRQYHLRVDLTDLDNYTSHAIYNEFWVSDEFHNYTLHAKGYSDTGTAGDALSYHDGVPFSTRDRDNDKSQNHNCAEEYRAGWWYRSCFQANLNGIYSKNPDDTELKRICWKRFKERGRYCYLTDTSMKLRPASFGVKKTE